MSDPEHQAREDDANRLIAEAEEYDGFNLQIRLARKAEGHSGGLALQVSLILNGELTGARITLSETGTLKEKIKQGLRIAAAGINRTFEEKAKESGGKDAQQD